MKKEKNTGNLLKGFHEQVPAIREENTLIVDQAYGMIENSDFESALKLLNSISGSTMDDPDIINGMGICLCELGHLLSAEKMLKHAIEEFPDDEITLSNLAGVYWEMNNFPEALYYYNKSFELDSENIDTRLNIINLYIDFDMPYMALAFCSETYKKFPDNSEIKELFDEIILNMAISIT